mmetsp:Transcript_41493/g.111079  ORF Transcript_41493/g.111079 Transcript_41493/m.111079 type:complete len:166 (-) Transcript_41493:288-785(-)
MPRGQSRADVHGVQNALIDLNSIHAHCMYFDVTSVDAGFRPVIAVTHLQNCQGFEVVSNVQNLSNDTKQWVKARNRALERCLSHFASDLGVSRLDLFPLELSGRKSCLLHTRCYASKDNLHKPENLCNDIGGKLNFISADQYVDMISALKARAMEYYGRVCPRAE